MQSTLERDVLDRRDTIVFEADAARAWIVQLSGRLNLLGPLAATLEPEVRQDLDRLRAALDSAGTALAYVAEAEACLSAPEVGT